MWMRPEILHNGSILLYTDLSNKNSFLARPLRVTRTSPHWLANFFDTKQLQPSDWKHNIVGSASSVLPLETCSWHRASMKNAKSTHHLLTECSADVDMVWHVLANSVTLARSSSRAVGWSMPLGYETWSAVSGRTVILSQNGYG